VDFEPSRWWFLVLAAVFIGIALTPAVRMLGVALKGHQQPPPTHVPTGPVWDWAKGAWVLWLGRMDEQLLTKQLAREFLSLQWGIHSAEAAERFLKRPPKDDPPRPTWRRVQQVTVARLVVPADFMAEHAAAGAVRKASEKLRKRFTTWDGVADRFTEENAAAHADGEGYKIKSERGLDPTVAAQHREQADSDVWPELAFDLDLEGGWSKPPAEDRRA
jgi:hypothetical protein